MIKLTKPKKLNIGDTVACLCLSWGAAGEADLKWRYDIGVERLKSIFKLKVVEMPHTLKSEEYLYNHPEKRAQDMMDAFRDPNIKAIFCCIGGDDAIRLMPYIDYDIIKNNPKIFMGYSDTTVNHFMCYKAGLASFYGASVMTDFAENIKMDEYTINSIRKTLFTNSPIGLINASPDYITEYVEWQEFNGYIERARSKNTPYELLQGTGTHQGRLIGGCLEVLTSIRGTTLFPELSDFTDSILFLETCEIHPPIWYIEDCLRTFGAMGILSNIRGILWGKPHCGFYYNEYKDAIIKILKEFGLQNLPILYNCSFGHNEPKMIVPYGAMAEIDCENKCFSILENAVE